MEQTLGKRITAHRKRLGMTQDRLAEQLGVTAQAVSKWENDQSCPDINILPKLAEIFGISTDELLGREHQTVHQAEVVEDAHGETESDGLHFQKGKWELKWDGGKKDGVALAVLVLLVGCLTLAARVLQWEASFWDILWPSALLVFGLKGLFSKFSFFRIGCTLFGGYYLIANLGIWELNIAGELVFPIIVVLFGISLLVDALRKPNKPHFTVTHDGNSICDSDGKKETKSTFTVDDDRFECSLSFGGATRSIHLPRLSGGEINCSFGELTVDLSGCEEIADDCEIEASCSFGQLNLLVPRKFRVDPTSSTAFASLEIEGQPDASPEGVIRLDGSVSFGAIQVRYV